MRSKLDRRILIGLFCILEGSRKACITRSSLGEGIFFLKILKPLLCMLMSISCFFFVQGMYLLG
jgi:hypothetical protein